MKRIFEDITSESFTRKEIIIFGILFPLALVAVCVLSEIIQNL